MKTYGFDNYDNDWLSEEKKRESRISAWDLDDSAFSLRQEHLDDCEAREIKENHERIHSSFKEHETKSSFKAEDAFRLLSESNGSTYSQQKKPMNNFKSLNDFNELATSQQFKNKKQEEIEGLVGMKIISGIFTFVAIIFFMSIAITIFSEYAPNVAFILPFIAVILIVVLFVIPIVKVIREANK